MSSQLAVNNGDDDSDEEDNMYDMFYISDEAIEGMEFIEGAMTTVQGRCMSLCKTRSRCTSLCFKKRKILSHYKCCREK